MIRMSCVVYNTRVPSVFSFFSVTNYIFNASFIAVVKSKHASKVKVTKLILYVAVLSSNTNCQSNDIAGNCQ